LADDEIWLYLGTCIFSCSQDLKYAGLKKKITILACVQFTYELNDNATFISVLKSAQVSLNSLLK